MLASSRLGRALCVLWCSFAALQACGGRSDMDDYYFSDDLPLSGSPGIGGANGRGANGSGANSSAGKRPDGAAGAPMMVGGSSGVGGSGIAQGGAISAGGKASGGGPAGGAAQGGVGQGGSGVAGSVAMGGTGVDAPVTCGNMVCNALIESCCATLGGLGCIPEDQACNGTVLNCGSSSDCGGNQVCCLRFLDEVGSGSECKNNCDGMGPGRERQLCNTDDDCRGNRTCRDTVFGVSVCTRF